MLDLGFAAADFAGLVHVQKEKLTRFGIEDTAFSALDFRDFPAQIGVGPGCFFRER